MSQPAANSIAYRDKFAAGEDIYLLSHSIGKMPKTASQFADRHFFAAWGEQTAEAWPSWLSAIKNFQTVLGELFTSTPEAFCPQANVSSGLAKVLAALPKKPGKNVILYTENDFPSAGFVIQQAERLGFKLRKIGKSEDPQDLGVWDQTLESDVHSVFITHVHYNTNKLIPVREICVLARERGITSIVDTAQSSGIVPISFHDWQADVVLGSCIKWLCGGPGAGFLWVAPEFITALQPVDVGWFSHRKPFEFNINNFEYAVDSAKFWGGTPSVLPYVIATNSIQTMLDIGIQTIRDHNKYLNNMIVERMDPAVQVSPEDPELKGGTTVLKFAHQRKIETALSSANVQFDSRELGIRLSPHIYNTAAEIEVVIDCLSGVQPNQ
ncbi:MAG: aminotransferase class V-fold PLP-dependent enzyme [Gammaproteobacteria bacterium]|nr:aminotransferase class V-fold PLP-dependent enzyme [Gammaproteobacteria bacterium]